MVTSALDRRVRIAVDDFVQKIAGLVRQEVAASVKDALAGELRRARSSRTATAATGTRGRGRPPSPEIARMGADLMKFVSSHPGLRLEEIARAMSVTTKDIKYPALKLIASRGLRTEGQARGTRYYATSTAKRSTAKKSGRKRAGRKKASRKTISRTKRR